MSLNNWEMTFKNSSGSTVPPFACMRATGVEAIGDRNIVTIGQPNTYGSQFSHYLNGPVEVADGSYGSCTNVFPAIAKAGTGTLTNGTIWGPRSGGWTIEKETGGFIVVGQHSSGLAIVDRFPMLVFSGKFTGSVSKGSTGTVTVYFNGTTTSQTISTVYAVSQAFTSSDWVNVYRIAERWEAYPRECP